MRAGWRENCKGVDIIGMIGPEDMPFEKYSGLLQELHSIMSLQLCLRLRLAIRRVPKSVDAHQPQLRALHTLADAIGSCFCCRLEHHARADFVAARCVGVVVEVVSLGHDIRTCNLRHVIHEACVACERPRGCM